jgi:hypothetical protein
MASQAMAGCHFNRLTKEQYEYGLSQIERQIAKHGLNVVAPKICIIGRNKKDRTTTVGTDRAVDVSILRYETIWRSAFAFCIEVADYDSAMIFARDICPTNPLPMSSESAIECLRFHVQEKGTRLMHHKTNLPINSSFTGLPLVCQGDWRSTHSISLYRSALSKVHMHYETTSGDYTDACKKCGEIPMDEVQMGKGCPRHPGTPHYWCKGMPTSTPDFGNNCSMLKEYVKIHYDARHTFAFYPGELRDLRLYLLSTNNKYKLMIWTIMLVGIKGFLRTDEVLNLKVEDLPQEYFAVTQNNVEGLCMTVQGKTDQEKQYLAIWDDKECTDLSPSRALLIWLAVTGITSGKLFPSAAEVESGTKSPVGSLGYDVFLKEIKDLCTGVLKKSADSPAMKHMIIGTHMLRKTGYLLAYWGVNLKKGTTETTPMDQASILLSARHKDTRSCVTYLSDAGTMLALCDKIRSDDVNQRVGAWQPIHIKTHDAFAALNVPSKKYIKGATDLADWYVFEKLGVPKDDQLGRMTIYQIHQLACEFVPDLSTNMGLHKFLEQHLPAHLLQEALAMVSKVCSAKVLEAVHHVCAVQQIALLDSPPNANGIHAVAVTPAGAIFPAATATPSPPSEISRKRKYNPEELVSCSKNFQQEVKQARKAKGLQVELLQQLVAEVRMQVLAGKILREPLKSFAYKAGRVDGCVKNCHNGSVAAFLLANKTFCTSRFQCCFAKNHSTTFDVGKI